MFSCNEHKNNKSGNVDNDIDLKQQVADSLFTQMKLLDSLYIDWQSYYRKKEPTFTLDSFIYISEYNEQFMVSNANLAKDFYKKYGDLVVYNSDSSKFIDLFSYYLVINFDKYGRRKRGGTEADQEVAVVDTKSHKKYRIFYCGTPCFVGKAVWTDKDKVALFGITTEDENGEYMPTIWLVDLSTASTTEYNYTRNTNVITPDEFLAKVLKKKGIED